VSDCTVNYRPVFSSEKAPLKEKKSNCQTKKEEQDKIWSRVPKGGPIPRRTDRLTVGRKKNSSSNSYIYSAMDSDVLDTPEDYGTIISVIFQIRNKDYWSLFFPRIELEILRTESIRLLIYVWVYVCSRILFWLYVDAFLKYFSFSQWILEHGC
jgi:hypothetical protein